MGKNKIFFQRLNNKQQETQRMIQFRKYLKVIEDNTTIELDEPVENVEKEGV